MESEKIGIDNLFYRNRDTDVEHKCMDTKGEEGWDEFGDWHWHIYTAVFKT